MTNSNAAEIPVIDIGGLFGPGRARAISNIAMQVDVACRSAGFFYVANHGVPDHLITEVFAANRTFHALPLEEKLKIKLNRWHRGYQALATSTLKSSARFEPAKHANQLESYILRHEVSPDHPDFQKKTLMGPNQWPADPRFMAAVKRYDTAIRQLGHQLLPIFSIAVGEKSEFFGRFFDPASTATRLIHYPPAPAIRLDDVYGIHPHTDYGFVTILAQDYVGGLEVRRVDSSWIPVGYLPGTLVVNIGDILARWTNDQFSSTPHRVINKSSFRDRYSIATFFDPNIEASISCLPRFAGAEVPARYQPIRYGEYYQMRLDANYPDRVGVTAGD
jgi:isopenicillin N synthase-like dioxygenase